MPITQERMMALIQATEDALHSLDNVQKSIARAYNNAALGKVDSLEALHTLVQVHSSVATMLRDQNTIMVWKIEKERFQRNRSRNRAATNYRRRKAGKPPLAHGYVELYDSPAGYNVQDFVPPPLVPFPRERTLTVQSPSPEAELFKQRQAQAMKRIREQAPKPNPDDPDYLAPQDEGEGEPLEFEPGQLDTGESGETE